MQTARRSATERGRAQQSAPRVAAAAAGAGASVAAAAEAAAPAQETLTTSLRPVVNPFSVKNDEVWTSTGEYCMNGITRKKVIMLCKQNNIPIFEKNFYLEDVYEANECFITGTLGSLTPVLELDRKKFSIII